MKAAARPALVPALLFCAALAAAPEAASAGEKLRAPFPGVESAGGGTAVEAASPGPAGTGPEAVNAAAGRAQPETADGSAAMGTPERQAKTPPGGSRLLRVLGQLQGDPAAAPEASGAAALAGPGVSGPGVSGPGVSGPGVSGAGVSGAGVSGTGVFGAGVSGTSVFAVEGCPRALLRRLLAGAAGEADALAALGIEREILALCRERQEILVGLFEAEAALRELRTPPDAPAAAVLPPAQTGAVSIVPAPTRQVAPTPAPSPLRATLTAAGTADETDMGAEDARAGDTGAEDTRAGELQPPRYAWFSIVGAAGALRAGITDGADVWFVREGDRLPGGARIAAIAARPPGVRMTDGDGDGGTALLPYEDTSFSSTSFRARPGGAP